MVAITCSMEQGAEALKACGGASQQVIVTTPLVWLVAAGAVSTNRGAPPCSGPDSSVPLGGLPRIMRSRLAWRVGSYPPFTAPPPGDPARDQGTDPIHPRCGRCRDVPGVVHMRSVIPPLVTPVSAAGACGQGTFIISSGTQELEFCLLPGICVLDRARVALRRPESREGGGPPPCHGPWTP